MERFLGGAKKDDQPGRYLQDNPEKNKGKRHNRVYPGQNATQQGTYLFTE